MKKIFLTILAFVFIFSLAGPVMAKKIKAPKSLCLESTEMSMSISTSKGGKIVIAAGKINSYDIQGLLIHSTSTFPNPISGSGYMMGDLFVFSFSSILLGTELVPCNGDILWEVDSPTAMAVMVFHVPSQGLIESEIELTVIACDEFEPVSP